MKTLPALKTLCFLGLAALLPPVASAQVEASLTNFFTPPFRALPNSESVMWNDSFTNAFGGSNGPVTVAPGGSALARAAVSQTTSGAFIIAGGDIYSFSSAHTFVLNYSVTNFAAYPNGIGAVVFQTEHAGTELDYASVALKYTACSGAQTLAAVRNELYRSTGNDGGFGESSDVVSAWQFPALPADVTSFSIVFNAAGTSQDFERAMLDVAPAPASPNTGPFSFSDAAGIERWVYAFNSKPANRPSGPTFGALGDTGDFDTRDAQFLLGWSTSNSIPAGQGARNYLIRRARVTLTTATTAYAYNGTLRDYRTFLPPADPRYIAPASSNFTVELFGAGFRGATTNQFGTVVPFSSLNYPQNGPYGAYPGGGGPYGAFTNRVAYNAGYDASGLLVDVSNNVGDDGTNEVVVPFEVAPFAVGYTTNYAPGQILPADTVMTFDINLDDPLIYGYLQQGLNDGNLSLIASSLHTASLSGTPTYPDFYTKFNLAADPAEYPILSIEGTVVRSCTDTDADGLPDDWEQFYFGSLSSGATNVSNGDGISNLAKYRGGMNPTNSATDLRLLSITHQQDTTEIRFVHAPSRQYNIQWSSNLTAWQSITNPAIRYSSAWLDKTGANPVYPSPVYAGWKDTNAVGLRFYRVATH